MRLRPDSRHVLPEPRRIHRLSREQKILIKAQRGTLTPDEALDLVIPGSKISPHKLAATAVAKAKRLL
jgi:hypothetical protein